MLHNLVPKWAVRVLQMKWSLAGAFAELTPLHPANPHLMLSPLESFSESVSG